MEHIVCFSFRTAIKMMINCCRAIIKCLNLKPIESWDRGREREEELGRAWESKEQRNKSKCRRSGANDLYAFSSDITFFHSVVAEHMSFSTDRRQIHLERMNEWWVHIVCHCLASIITQSNNIHFSETESFSQNVLNYFNVHFERIE